MKTIKSVVVVLTALLAVGMVACSNAPAENASAEALPGNSVGNIANNAYVAIADDTIYYVNRGDDFVLYSMRADGTQKTQLNSNDTCYGINVVGDRVYYCGDLRPNDPNDKLKSENQGLFSMRSDGSEVTQLSNGASYSMTVVGDWIYYCNSKGNICKMRVDGKKKTTLYEADCANLNVVGDWIYYRNTSDNNYLYIIRTDGKENTLINSDSSFFINVVDDWVYYRNESDNGYLYKIRIDGTERTLLDAMDSRSINAVGDWIYYSYYVTASSGGWNSLGNALDDIGIYKIRSDGTDKTRLNNDLCKSINVAGDWVYYINELDDGYLHRMRTDGAENQRVTN